MKRQQTTYNFLFVFRDTQCQMMAFSRNVGYQKQHHWIDHSVTRLATGLSLYV